MFVLQYKGHIFADKIMKWLLEASEDSQNKRWIWFDRTQNFRIAHNMM